MASDHLLIRVMLLKMLSEMQTHRMHQKEISLGRTLYPSEVDLFFSVGSIKRFYGAPPDDYQKVSRWMDRCRTKFEPRKKEFVNELSGWPSETNIEAQHEFDLMFLPNKDEFDFSYDRAYPSKTQEFKKQQKEPEIWNALTRKELSI